MQNNRSQFRLEIYTEDANKPENVCNDERRNTVGQQILLLTHSQLISQTPP
jgi:hypothetical protein